MPEHYSKDFYANDKGWWTGRCACGWDGGERLLSRLADAEAKRDRAVEALRRYVAVSPWKNRPDDQLTDEEAELLAVLAAVPVEEERPDLGLPPDLLRVLRDPTITIDRDHEIRLADGRTLFDHLQEWRNAPSDTASGSVEELKP